MIIEEDLGLQFIDCDKLTKTEIRNLVVNEGFRKNKNCMWKRIGVGDYEAWFNKHKKEIYYDEHKHWEYFSLKNIHPFIKNKVKYILNYHGYSLYDKEADAVYKNLWVITLGDLIRLLN